MTKVKFESVDMSNLDNEFFDIYTQGYEYHRNLIKSFLPKTKEEHIKDIDEMLKVGKIFKIFLNNELIGILIYQIKNKPYGNVFWVSQIVLSENNRGKGYITNIFSEMKQLAKQEDCNNIMLDCWFKNKHANEVYKHLGFKERTIQYEYKLD